MSYKKNKLALPDALRLIIGVGLILFYLLFSDVAHAWPTQYGSVSIDCCEFEEGDVVENVLSIATAGVQGNYLLTLSSEKEDRRSIFISSPQTFYLKGVCVSGYSVVRFAFAWSGGITVNSSSVQEIPVVEGGG